MKKNGLALVLLLSAAPSLFSLTEEEITLAETDRRYLYSLSNNPAEIERAITARTGETVDLGMVEWRLNSGLSASVKDLMNKRNVNYSMTAYTAEGYRHIVVNKRSGREWYIFSVRIPSTTRAAADDALERGNAYADKGDYDRAIADFTQALRINPNQPMRMITAALPMPTKGTMTGLSLTLPRHSG